MCVLGEGGIVCDGTVHVNIITRDLASLELKVYWIWIHEFLHSPWPN